MLRVALLALFAAILLAASARAQSALPGEFTDIDFGRTLIEPKRFPTLKELREAVRRPEIASVLMLKLHGDGNNHYLPVWSPDGQRLALQRSNIEKASSKLLVYNAMSQPLPTLLGEESASYDYMFRWGLNSPAAFIFTRLESGSSATELMFSGDGLELKTQAKAARRLMPALYERTDRIWRLAYEQEGQVMHEAFDAEARVADPLSLGRGTSPRWASDGFRLLMLRGRSGGQLAAYDVVVRNLRTEKELVLADKGVLRGPVWSPDEQSAAFYVRDPGDNKPWRIQVASAVEERKVHDLGADVVVNENFESEGPSWEPGGRRIWFFSKQHRKEGYYPLVAADVASGKLAVVDYPSRCTTPFDLAINPVTEAPELVFVAHDGLPQDVFVLFLNHY